MTRNIAKLHKPKLGQGLSDPCRPLVRDRIIGFLLGRLRLWSGGSKRDRSVSSMPKKGSLAKPHPHAPFEVIQHGIQMRAVFVKVAQHETALKARYDQACS